MRSLLSSGFVRSPELSASTSEETTDSDDDEKWEPNSDWDHDFNNLHPFLLYTLNNIANARFLGTEPSRLEFVIGIGGIIGRFGAFVVD